MRHHAFRKCYDAGLRRNPKLEGYVNARFVIAEDGTVTKVTNAGSSMPDREVLLCALSAFYDLRFAAPSGGGIVTVFFPISFQYGLLTVPL